MPSTLSRDGTAVQYLASSVTGLLFGLALEKGRVYEPIIIREQMLMSNFTMLKMFLSASAAGMLSFSVLTMLPSTCKKMDKALNEFVFALGSKRTASATLGGVLLGCGITLSGACPGMVLIQVGAGVSSAVYTLIGAICGAFFYAFTEEGLNHCLNGDEPAKYQTLDEYLETSYINLALPGAAVLGISVFALDLFAPWRTEVEVYGDGIFGVSAWPPYAAGTLIGLLQIPIVLFVGDTLGTSTGITTLAAQTLFIKSLRGIFPRLERFKSGLINWWQVFFMSGAIVGAFASSAASSSRGTVAGVKPAYGFAGGLLLIVGSRLAGGCTSGHGLSGMGLMALLSLVVVPAMFGAGIGTAFLLKYGLGLDIDQI